MRNEECHDRTLFDADISDQEFADASGHGSGPSLERVPRVPRHPLRFGNGCQAPVLIRVKAHQTEKITKNVSQIIDFKSKIW